MEYLIPIMVVLLLVTGAVTFVVMNATRKSKPSEAQSSDDPDPKTMAATDSSPLGDTTEHAGDQSQEGETVRAPEGEGEREREGEGEGERSASGGDSGGSAERSGDTRPQSERLADRHQV
jgi:hypothetical protein